MNDRNARGPRNQRPRGPGKGTPPGGRDRNERARDGAGRSDRRPGGRPGPRGDERDGERGRGEERRAGGPWKRDARPPQGRPGGGRPRREDRTEDQRPGRGGPRTADGPRGPRPGREERSGAQRPGRGGRPAADGLGGRRSFGKRDDARSGPRPARPGARGPERPPRAEKPWKRQSRDERTFTEGDPLSRRPFRKGERSNRFSLPNPANEGLIRLNKYLANAGVGSRREADELITTGAVTVNGKVVTELGIKVRPEDVVVFGGQRLSMEQKRYVLLNKPKDTITTTDDPEERHTVMHLVARACSERIYPVGRLDRNTTGVLLLTNDGELAKKLTHPSHGAEKLYHVTLDKNVLASHLRELVQGVHLEDGLAQADEASYVSGAESKREVGLKLHMGRNRIVRRMFEALGYDVVKLDRVMFSGLTKKDLQRGHWRHLTEKEVTWLKQLKAPTVTEKPKGRLRRSHGHE
jgi:23S rRNA pseudouridine2605 synthase